MKLLLLAGLFAATALFGGDLRDEPSPSELNVNSRYTVEGIDLAPQRDYELSRSVVLEMHRLIGDHLNLEALNRLQRRLAEELRANHVSFRLCRGNEPAHVRVTFDIERPTRLDVSLSQVVYNSDQGWSGTGQLAVSHGANAVTLSVISNDDTLIERYSGARIRYDRLSAGSSRIHLGFEYDYFQNLFDSSTLRPLAGGNSISSLGAGAYRSRMNVEPSATFVISRPLTFSVGMSFESMQPDVAGTSRESANALFGTLRYHLHSADLDNQQFDLDAAYRLRTASGLLGSDSVYTKHSASFRYFTRRNRQSAEVTIMAGMIYGRAPLFERFVLGNNTTLRGWNKFELDPLGGNRVATASVTYGYRVMRVFYDTGSIWDHGNKPELKHSAGIGLNTGMGLFGKDALLLAVAFPLRMGHVNPVFIAGMNF